MAQLRISIGQHSDKGRKPSNQDFHGFCIPKEPQLASKGVAVAIADGISSSDVSHIASHTAVTSFLEDYYCTSDSWSVKTSVERVLAATNSWLYSQTQQSQGRYDKDRGYVCTLSAMVIKSTTAHLFHAGDTRIYQLHGNTLEQLTKDHRVSMAPGQSYLSRALGVDGRLDIDYRSLPVQAGDIFLLSTDGVHEYVDAGMIARAIHDHAGDLDAAAKAIVADALERGSPDNLTLQIVRIDALPGPESNEIVQQLSTLPLPPVLEARMVFDGYSIMRELHRSSRSHVYLAIDNQTGATVALKIPSTELRDDPAYLERFLMEEWVARRLDSPHVLKTSPPSRARNYLYVVTEFIDGQTLAQWMTDHPKADLQSVRSLVEQIARGLRAFHRLEMLHQDLRPANVMIDATGTAKIIDFGATRVAGVAEIASQIEQPHLLGTAPFTAPEYFVGETASPQSDLFSLGVLTYHLLTGQLPYDTRVAQCKSPSDLHKLVYRPIRDLRRDIPHWVDEAVRKAVQPNPLKRHEDVSEFVFDLHHPNAAFISQNRPPLIDRNPLKFWKGLSLLLMMVIVALLAVIATRH